MEQYFNGKTVLVTGAGWGIGAATALLYAACGAKVIVADTSRQGGKDIVARIKSQKGNATYIRTDISSAEACDKLIKRTIETYGSIDIASNNSAIFRRSHPSEKGMGIYGDEACLNLNNLDNCMHYEIEAMQKQGGGVIVNSSCIMGAICSASLSRYVDTKYGMKALSKDVRYPVRGIHINTISPALINTAMLNIAVQTERERQVKSSPMNGPGMIQDVAGLVLWLSSHETHFLSTVFTGNN